MRAGCVLGGGGGPLLGGVGGLGAGAALAERRSLRPRDRPSCAGRDRLRRDRPLPRGREAVVNLDRRSGAELLDLLRACVVEMGQTVVMVTHDPAAAARADRVQMLADGRLADDLAAPSLTEILRRFDQSESTKDAALSAGEAEQARSGHSDPAGDPSDAAASHH